jgi:hypothetical protein
VVGHIGLSLVSHIGYRSHIGLALGHIDVSVLSQCGLVVGHIGLSLVSHIGYRSHIGLTLGHIGVSVLSQCGFVIPLFKPVRSH